MHPRRLPLAAFLMAFMLGCRAGEVTVNQINERFDRDGLSMTAGDTVTFTNSDPVKHNLTVVAPDEESTDLGMEKPGTQVSYTALKPGTYDVHCSIHPRMRLKIRVQ